MRASVQFPREKFVFAACSSASSETVKAKMLSSSVCSSGFICTLDLVPDGESDERPPALWNREPPLTTPRSQVGTPGMPGRCTGLELRPMFVGSVILIGWRGIIVVCATIISRTMIIRSGVVWTVRPRTVSIGPVAIAAIGGHRAYDGAGRKAADDTGGSRSAVT